MHHGHEIVGLGKIIRDLVAQRREGRALYLVNMTVAKHVGGVSPNLDLKEILVVAKGALEYSVQSLFVVYANSLLSGEPLDSIGLSRRKSGKSFIKIHVRHVAIPANWLA